MAASKAFRRDVEEFDRLVGFRRPLDVFEHVGNFAGTLGGIDDLRPNSERIQFVRLILHERYERRNDDRDAFSAHARNLVRQRFSSARRHEDHGVFTGHDGVDDFILPFAEGFETENVPKNAFGRWGHWR